MITPDDPNVVVLSLHTQTVRKTSIGARPEAVPWLSRAERRRRTELFIDTMASALAFAKPSKWVDQDEGLSMGEAQRAGRFLLRRHFALRGVTFNGNCRPVMRCSPPPDTDLGAAHRQAASRAKKALDFVESLIGVDGAAYLGANASDDMAPHQ